RQSWPRIDDARAVAMDASARGALPRSAASPKHLASHSEGFAALCDGNRMAGVSRSRLPIGRDGRNRPSLFPFGADSGRNAHAKSPFNTSAGMRGLILTPEGSILSYLDWRTQEVGVAAALSGDQALADAYNAGDVYHALARIIDPTTEPDWRVWKKTRQAVRDFMKKVVLAINYGMGVPSLARSL